MKNFLIFLIFICLFKIDILKQEFGFLSENEDLEEITINGEIEQEFTIKGNISYIFTIMNEKYFYCFTSWLENIFFIKNENNTFEVRLNETFFENGEKIYVNHLKNLNDTKIKISPFNIYNELNSIETIKENQYFFIKSKYKSIAYFDSFDKNSRIYLSKSRIKQILPEDQRISGKFKEIEPNSIYLIKNAIYDISVFKKYFYPIIYNESVINIKSDDKNFFYLGQSGVYTLNFTENFKNMMIKLSTKTSKAKIKIIKEEKEIKELNKNTPYFILDKNFIGETRLKIEENDAFIELLFNYGEFEIITDEIKTERKINKNIQIIKLPVTQKSIEIIIKSNKNIKYSVSLGLTNDENYFYSSSSNLKINTHHKEEILLYYSLFKDINILKDEFISIAINFEKDENQDISILYSQFSQIDEFMDEPMEAERCKEIINLLQKLFERYVYQDIAQNPPDVGIPNYHHRKINLIEEIGKIPSENRKFYEFYQDIKKTISIVRDGHLDITPHETPKGIKFFDYGAVLPFKYVVKKHKDEIRLFISIRENIIKNYDFYTQKFLKSHEEIPIKTINDKDPFDYVQNWTDLSNTKNPHTNFVFNIEPSTEFFFYLYPLNYSDLLDNEYEFDDNQMIKVSYQIAKPEKSKLKIKKSKYSRFLTSLHKVKNKFHHFNRIDKSELKEINEEPKVNWDIFYEEDDFYIKCRVDEEKEVNVFVQNSFDLKYENSAGQIFNCAELFHSNNYPIIIIENKNEGGDPKLAYLMIQLFQMREVERSYGAIRYIENLHNFDFNKDFDSTIHNPITCKVINSYEELGQTIDYYNYSGLNITHKRSNVYVELEDFEERKAYNEFRKKYQDSPNLKKPTDIIIFTDGVSFSSTSTLIKGFQNIGGAIIVGYAGNPKIEGTDLFDGSQSDSSISDFKYTEIYKKLKKLGYIIGGLTFAETFDDSFKSPNPIPREYTMIPIDYRTDIYSFYSDDLYDEFIEEGKEIHKLFNQNKYCNYKNSKLLLHDDVKCKFFENLEHAHGGLKCGENNKWSDECSPYYCDIGYSFDQELKKCVKDCMVDWPVYFIYADDFSNTYNIKNDEKLEFITLNPNGLYYVFESSENVIKDFPKISFIKGKNNVIINDYKNSSNDISLEINTVETEIDIMNFRADALLLDKILNFNVKKMIVFQSNNEHILFFNKILNDSDINKIKYLKYNDSIQYQDILDIKEELFTNYSGNSFNLEKEETYIILIDYNNNEQIDITINPLVENILFDSNKMKMNYLYLQKGKTYTLKFSNDIENIMIKLSRETLNSEISINDNKALLNSINLYYLYETNNNLNQELKLKIDKNDAKIEFLYNLTNDNYIEDINFEKSNINLKNEINILKIPKEFKNINLEINIKEGEQYSLYQGYSIPPFSHDFEVDEENRISSNINITISEPYNPKIKLMNDEYYIVMIRLYDDSEVDISINGVKEKNNDKDQDQDQEKKVVPVNNKGLKWYEIILIVVGAIVFLIIVIIIIILIRRKKRMSDKLIEDKVNDLTAVSI